MAVHLSGAGDRERQQAGRTGWHADQLRTDLIERHEQFLRASARKPDLPPVRNGDAPPSAGGPSRKLCGIIRHVQRRPLSRHPLYGRCRDRRRICAMGSPGPRNWSGPRQAGLCRPGQAEQGGHAVHLSRHRAQSVQQHRKRCHGHARRLSICVFNVAEGRAMNLLGKLDWNAIPLHEPIIMGATAFMVLVVLVVLGFVTAKGAWPYLWREWLTSVDHKRIGAMYCILALVMMLRGFSDAIMIRAQQALAAGGAQGYLPPEHFNQIFSAHGTIMILFMAMPFVVGLMNLAVPLQLGVRDVAFPTLNSVSFWLTASGALLVNISLAVGEFSRAGWWGYPPLSELQYSPGVGVDYYLWSLQISGIGTLLAGINFVTTILKMRAPGMGYGRMPVFCWTALASNLLIVAGFPVLTATFAMLLLDRYLGFHFFTVDGGGNAMMYINLFWVWGHPEVYILVLPAFGVYSEVSATFSGKPLFGYRSMVGATMAICVLSYTVWLHHCFTMGASAAINAFFGITSMIIAVPTGVKIFNWLFTMYGDRVRFTVPVLWTIVFMVTFVFGGLTGVLLALPPVDWQVHNSLFLVAHFHNVIIGGTVFGLMAGYNYWFPKAFGFMLDERWGKAAFWCWLIGFYVG